MCKPNLNEATVSVSIDERRVYTYNDKSGLVIFITVII